MVYHKLIKIYMYMCDSSINALSKKNFWLVWAIWETHYGATQMHTQPQCCVSHFVAKFVCGLTWEGLYFFMHWHLLCLLIN